MANFSDAFAMGLLRPSSYRTSAHGPWEYQGDLYALGHSGGGGTAWRISRSTDNGETWANPTYIYTGGSHANTADAVRIGNLIYVLLLGGSGSWATRILTFNLATKVWDELVVTNTGVDNSPDPVINITGFHPGYLAVRASDYLVGFHSPIERVMGNDYRRFGYAIWNGSSWSRVLIPAWQAGATEHFDLLAMTGITGTDSVHFYYKRSSISSIRSRSNFTGGGWSGETTLFSAFFGDDHYTGRPQLNDGELGLVYLGTATSAGGNAGNYIAKTTSPPITNSHRQILPHGVFGTRTSPTGIYEYDDKGVCHVFIVGDSSVAYTNDQGTGDWTPQVTFVSEAVTFLSVGFVGSHIGVMYKLSASSNFVYKRVELAAPPDAPTLLTPEDNAIIDGSSQNTFTWQHNGDDAQEEFLFRRDGMQYTQVQQLVDFSSSSFTDVFTVGRPSIGFEVRERISQDVVHTFPNPPYASQFGADAKFSPDGRYLGMLWRSSDAVIADYIWIADSQDNWSYETYETWSNNGSNVNFVYWSDDGRYFIAPHGNKLSGPRVTIVDTQTKAIVYEYTARSNVYQAGFASDLSYLVLVNNFTSDWHCVVDPLGTPTNVAVPFGKTVPNPRVAMHGGVVLPDNDRCMVFSSFETFLYDMSDPLSPVLLESKVQPFEVNRLGALPSGDALALHHGSSSAPALKISSDNLEYVPFVGVPIISSGLGRQLDIRGNEFLIASHGTGRIYRLEQSSAWWNGDYFGVGGWSHEPVSQVGSAGSLIFPPGSWSPHV